MVAMALDPASTDAHQGYWLASADGGVFSEGGAGSTARWAPSG